MSSFDLFCCWVNHRQIKSLNSKNTYEVDLNEVNESNSLNFAVVSNKSELAQKVIWMSQCRVRVNKLIWLNINTELWVQSLLSALYLWSCAKQRLVKFSSWTVTLWNSLPCKFFPGHYNLNLFKSRISSYLSYLSS